jgi:hypothetical protein
MKMMILSVRWFGPVRGLQVKRVFIAVKIVLNFCLMSKGKVHGPITGERTILERN